MKKEEFIERAANAVKAIKGVYNKGVIKEHLISNLVNIKTAEDTGIDVELLLNTKYDYFDIILNEWKSKLDADSFYVSVKRNQLRVHFQIYY